MKLSGQTMGMPAVIEITDPAATKEALESVLALFNEADERFSTYKNTSEISRINSGAADPAAYSSEMKEVLKLCEQTKEETNGYFDIRKNNILDPSGLVKGWAIRQAARQLQRQGFTNFYLDIGSDIQVSGKNEKREPWRIGIRNPFNPDEIIKVLAVTDKGIATSGTYERGQHVYNPRQPKTPINDIVSLTVIAPDIYEADRFATAAFAMGKSGIRFVESLPGIEGYMINNKGIATQTSGFESFILHS